MRSVFFTFLFSLVMIASWSTWSFAESLSSKTNLFSTERNYQKGDVVSVVISESAQASQSARTALSKDSEVGYSTGGVLGSLVPSASVGMNSEHEGGGQLARQGKMKAMVAAIVEDIMPNGNLKIKGQQEMSFDSGRQLIRVEGLVRPRDISSQNEVYSYRIANAKIEYTGDGALHEKARTGFLARFLDWLWIF